MNVLWIFPRTRSVSETPGHVVGEAVKKRPLNVYSLEVFETQFCALEQKLFNTFHPGGFHR